MPKDKGAAPPRSLNEKELEMLEEALRAATPPPWTAAFSATTIRPEVHGPLPIGGTPSDAWALRVAALTSREDAALIAALRNVAHSLISDIRSERDRSRGYKNSRDNLSARHGEVCKALARLVDRVEEHVKWPASLGPWCDGEKDIDAGTGEPGPCEDGAALAQARSVLGNAAQRPSAIASDSTAPDNEGDDP